VDGSVFMLDDFGEASCSLLLPILATCSALVTQSSCRRLNCIMIVAIRNLRVEYGYWTVKQTYDSILNNVVKLINGL
jgi:hypothetical protein